MASPPGFTSAIEPKHVQTYRSIPPIQLPALGLSAAAETVRSEFLKSRVAFARLEAEILGRHKTLKERDLSPETVKTVAPEYADDYLKAWTRREEARRAYEALTSDAPDSRATGDLGPTAPGQSAVFKGLVAGRKRTTRKPRKSRKHGSARILHNARRRVSRRNATARAA
jgi:hypothetical protein